MLLKQRRERVIWVLRTTKKWTDDRYLFVCRPRNACADCQTLLIHITHSIAFAERLQLEKAEVLFKVSGSQWEMIRNQNKGIAMRSHVTFYSFRAFYTLYKSITTLSYTAG